MSSFYDDASLVVIPSGYKTSKVYAEKPTDGSGDLAFTRTGDTATRVNSAGLIEKVRTNLVTFSEDFANAAWTKNNATVTSNTQANPVNGAVTADTITATASVGYVSSAAIALSAIPYTISMYAKKSNVDWVSIEVSDGVANSAKSWYNIANGTLGTTGGTYTITGRTITSAGNGWYRCTLTFNVTSATNYSFVPFFVASDGALSVNGNAGFGFGAQVETTDFGATAYIPTTTAAVSVGMVANTPRLDFLGSTCGKLLLEPQRTNLVTYSEQFNNAAWSTSDVTVTANSTISPSGYQDGDTINAIAVDQRINQSITVSASTQYIFSFYAKKGTMATPRYSVYDLSNGAFILTQVDYSSLVNTSTWSRITATFTTPSGCTSIGVYPINGASTGTIFLWGAQVEAGAYATSYIPTLAASATRGADACSKTGISSLIGQTEGTLFIETSAADLTTFKRIAISSGSYLSSVYLDFRNDGSVVASSWTTSGLALYVTVTPSNPTSKNKYAIAYKSNDWAIYVNGVLAATQSTGTVSFSSTLNTLEFALGGNDNFYGKADSVLLFKTRLTNAQLAELTTL